MKRNRFVTLFLVCLVGAAFVAAPVRGQSTEEDIQRYRAAAEQGDAEAQNKLGLVYYNGQGVVQSYEEAAKWFRKAAEQGHAIAQGNLGFAYDKGLGVPQSYTEAAKWYRKAAEQGNAIAQNNLGFAYDNGQGVPQSWQVLYLRPGSGAVL